MTQESRRSRRIAEHLTGKRRSGAVTARLSRLRPDARAAAADGRRGVECQRVFASPDALAEGTKLCDRAAAATGPGPGCAVYISRCRRHGDPSAPMPPSGSTPRWPRHRSARCSPAAACRTRHRPIPTRRRSPSERKSRPAASTFGAAAAVPTRRRWVQTGVARLERRERGPRVRVPSRLRVRVRVVAAILPAAPAYRTMRILPRGCCHHLIAPPARGDVEQTTVTTHCSRGRAPVRHDQGNR